MRGRPSKLTPEVQQRLCDAIAAGNYYQAACGYAGISYKVFREWMLKGEKARSGQFRDFRDAVTKAKTDAEVQVVAFWRAQLPSDWRACRDFLARRYPQRWGPMQRHEMKAKADVTSGGEPFGRDTLTAEDLANTAKLAAEAHLRLQPYEKAILEFLEARNRQAGNGAPVEMPPPFSPPEPPPSPPPAEPPPAPPPSPPPPPRFRI
jgi:hypothetical protein